MAWDRGGGDGCDGRVESGRNGSNRREYYKEREKVN